VYTTVNPGPGGAGLLVAVDAGTGTIRWQLAPPAIARGTALVDPPIVDGQTAFVDTRVIAPGTNATSEAPSVVSAVDTHGHVLWSQAPSGTVGGLAAEPGHTLYVASVDHLTNPPDLGSNMPFLTGYAETDGAVRSKVVAKISTDSTSDMRSIRAANGLVYGTQDYGHGAVGVGSFALRPDTGDLVWSSIRQLDAVSSRAILANDDPGSLCAVDAKTGASQWCASIAPHQAAVIAGTVVLAIVYSGQEGTPSTRTGCRTASSLAAPRHPRGSGSTP
jgi:outer membrane protein assembly factor BamB